MTSIADQHFTQNRELSWLRFNERVLDEATDAAVPLLERMNFVSIFTSNLDEFFMIRVGSLFDLKHLKEDSIDNKTGLTPGEQLDLIYTAVRPLYEKREAVFFELTSQLRAHDIWELTYDELNKSDRKFVEEYYRSQIEPILSPQIMDLHHPFPHLQNKVLHVCARLRDGDQTMFAIVPLPQILPEILFLPGSQVRFLPTDVLIRQHLEELFGGCRVVEHATICVTRNADVSLDDEAYDDMADYRKKMRSVLRQRRRLAPVRLELSNPVSGKLQHYLGRELGLKEEQMFITTAPLRLGFVGEVANRITPEKRRALTYRPFTPQPSPQLREGESVLHQVRRKDVLLSFPYESMNPFLNLIREAANDPNTISIKITIYRLAKDAKLVEYLCAAAENGKEVTAFIELRARFDEQNNIDWSERLEAAGCTVLYGMEDFKVHSKICLITRRERGEIAYITQIGTGNYNEKTAKQYADLSLMTADHAIGLDAADFFKNMAIGNLDGSYRHLLVSPSSLKSRVMDLIDEEMKKGTSGRITLKLNSITDVDLIEKLMQASCAGVQIRMIVRGICCILPGIPGKTEHITVTSLVGRYLEHARVYCFGSGTSEKIYISSADFMTRNTERRVEVACPVRSEPARSRIRQMLSLQLADTEKARRMLPDGSYAHTARTGVPVDAQQTLMQLAEERAQSGAGAGGHTERLRELLSRVLRRGRGSAH